MLWLREILIKIELSRTGKIIKEEQLYKIK